MSAAVNTIVLHDGVCTYACSDGRGLGQRVKGEELQEEGCIFKSGIFLSFPENRLPQF